MEHPQETSASVQVASKQPTMSLPSSLPVLLPSTETAPEPPHTTALPDTATIAPPASQATSALSVPVTNANNKPTTVEPPKNPSAAPSSTTVRWISIPRLVCIVEISAALGRQKAEKAFNNYTKE
jgi:hypothetical protein